MNRYENLEQEAGDRGITVDIISFRNQRIKGLYCDGSIAINADIQTTAERACILAEEVGHYYTASGNILDMSSVINRKQEHLGRMWAYNKLIGLIGIIDAFEHGCQSKFEIAEYLDVTEDFLSEAISAYHAKYGVYKIIDNYVIYFIPNLSVVKFLG